MNSVVVKVKNLDLNWPVVVTTAQFARWQCHWRPFWIGIVLKTTFKEGLLSKKDLYLNVVTSVDHSVGSVGIRFAYSEERIAFTKDITFIKVRSAELEGYDVLDLRLFLRVNLNGAAVAWTSRVRRQKTLESGPPLRHDLRQWTFASPHRFLFIRILCFSMSPIENAES